jgi:hypothetical protein
VTARKTAKAGPEPETQDLAEVPVCPPFWIADVPLPVSTEMGNGAIVRAFNPGDLVPVDHVERYGWQQYVHAPDGDWPPPDPGPDQAAEPSGAKQTGDAGETGSE